MLEKYNIAPYQDILQASTAVSQAPYYTFYRNRAGAICLMYLENKNSRTSHQITLSKLDIDKAATIEILVLNLLEKHHPNNYATMDSYRAALDQIKTTQTVSTIMDDNHLLDDFISFIPETEHLLSPILPSPLLSAQETITSPQRREESSKNFLDNLTPTKQNQQITIPSYISPSSQKQLTKKISRPPATSKATQYQSSKPQQQQSLQLSLQERNTLLSIEESYRKSMKTRTKLPTLFQSKGQQPAKKKQRISLSQEEMDVLRNIEVTFKRQSKRN